MRGWLRQRPRSSPQGNRDEKEGKQPAEQSESREARAGDDHAGERTATRAGQHTGPPATAVRCDVINVLLADGAGPAYLTMHDGLSPHLHFASDDDPLVSRVKAVTASGLAIFAVGASGQRLGVCARAGCSTVFYDTSRNGTRTYCTARCGNHEAVRRHRGGRVTHIRVTRGAG